MLWPVLAASFDPTDFRLFSHRLNSRRVKRNFAAQDRFAHPQSARFFIHPLPLPKIRCPPLTPRWFLPRGYAILILLNKNQTRTDIENEANRSWKKIQLNYAKPLNN